jgi:hypothetical protein
MKSLDRIYNKKPNQRKVKKLNYKKPNNFYKTIRNNMFQLISFIKLMNNWIL